MGDTRMHEVCAALAVAVAVAVDCSD